MLSNAGIGCTFSPKPILSHNFSVPSIDLNCDIGEGFPHDANLMDYVSSVNIACGQHAGDRDIMRLTVDIAVAKNVAIGAHPSYPGQKDFGRTPVDHTQKEIFDTVTEQLYLLQQICESAGATLAHVKPHGALYNRSAVDEEVAGTIANAVYVVDDRLILFGLADSLSITEGKKLGLRTACEVFADRTYSPDGTLTPRTEPNALITKANLAVAQVLEIVNKGRVTATNGKKVRLTADTICIHGDGENAVTFAGIIRRELVENGFDIKPVDD